MVKKTIKKIETEAKEEALKEEQKSTKGKGCAFCQSKTKPAYFDIATLKRFISDRGKILPKAYTKTCSKHQRAVAKNVKYARHLALLPFTPKV